MAHKHLIVIGAGGHAKVVLDLISDQDHHAIVAVVSTAKVTDTFFSNYNILRNDEDVLNYNKESFYLVNGVGSVGSSTKRQEIYNFFCNHGYRFLTIKHSSSIISKYVNFYEGSQVMAGCVIQAGCTIGANSIINTRASIDHDCFIGDHVHIAPGATLSGSITVGNGSHIGTGASIIQGVSIGCNVVVAAGAVVIGDVPDNTIVKGIPAR